MVATDEGIRPITGASVPTYIFASVFDLHGVADCCCGFMGASFTVEVVHLLDMAAAVLPAARGVMALEVLGFAQPQSQACASNPRKSGAATLTAASCGRPRSGRPRGPRTTAVTANKPAASSAAAPALRSHLAELRRSSCCAKLRSCPTTLK
eukprot:CAMPEP_0172937366 /NCGR_PEP_ID=MMETSP1075-20121228/222488_1 /TAXON_ID=2916 /ORGANISM="Ceratium fusus, Strain PA161109" /LENGTH=151 /DNA_ID=CAMNT_0013798741 /DNA_START=1050 /DNA_END=1506 /DNA_ORIENTATION=+